jgi:formylmethanofuran dehydrogenase subunit E
VVDYGKVAATFVDVRTSRAVRIAPQADVRKRASQYALHEKSRWHTQLAAYQRMPTEELLNLQEVTLLLSIDKVLSKPGYRVNCAVCGEEVLNEREIVRDGVILCRACAGESYYKAC